MTTKSQFDEFVSKLAAHDWYYAFSDDHSVYKRGEAASQAIRYQAKHNPTYQKAYDLWVNAMNAGISRGGCDAALAEIRAELGD